MGARPRGRTSPAWVRGCANAWPSMPEIGAYEAGVLLELAKDMLYQAYVRKGKLQQAMMVRRFFAEETLDRITPIGRAAGAE